jgi:hypothetical protein
VTATATKVPTKRRRGAPSSGTPSRAMRERRIRSTAIPAVRAAHQAGQISLYRAGEIARLPAEQQELAIAPWAARSLCRTEGSRLAAAAIMRDLRRYAKVDLNRVATAIARAVRAGS